MWIQGTKILVAGGTGLIGQPLVRLLQKEGAHVRVVSLDDPKLAPDDIEFMQLDLMSSENCMIACSKMDYVFNLLCAKGSPQAMRERPATFFDANILLDLLMLRAAYRCGVGGYLLASSLGVYPPAPIFKEDDVWKGFPSENDWYAGWAKRMGELQAEAYNVQFSMRTIVVRPTNTYGPYDDFTSPSAMVVPSLIHQAVTQKKMHIAGSGSEVRDFMYSEDCAYAMVELFRRDERGPTNIGTGIGVSIRELAECIASCTGASIVYGDSPAGDIQRVMDIQKLGLRPRTSLFEGVEKTIAWYTDHRGEKKRHQYS